MLIATFVVAAALAVVHIAGVRLFGLSVDHRHRWLSVGAGTTVAFAFLYLIPELDYFRRILTEHPTFGVVDELLYLVVLAGVTIYYGLEHLAYRVRQHHREKLDESRFGHDYVFWVHMGWYALYNVIIGALLLHGHQETVRGLVLYGVAMAIHFFTVDAAMRRHHRHVYKRTGRWILAAAVIAGWAIGAVVSIGPVVVASVTAFLIGGLLINAIKDELPPSRRAAFFPFLVGAGLSSAILIVM